MANVSLDNRNRDHSRFCYAADGQSVQIGPGAKYVPVDEKFLWKLDPDVIPSRNSTRVFETDEELQAAAVATEETPVAANNTPGAANSEGETSPTR